MTFDETQLSEALHEIDADVSPDFAARVRAGGRRRLVRRHSLVAVGAVAVGAGAVPATIAIRSADSNDTISVGAPGGNPGLYAAPPVAGSECNGGHGYKAPATAHADLLFLPPTTQDIGYAYVRDQTQNCAPPHVALTALRMHGDSVGEGLLVEGPNAPTPIEAGREGPNIDFFGNQGQQPIDGQPATEFSLDGIDHTDAYWTEPDGGQWHAVVRGMSQDDAVSLLNELSFQGAEGKALFPDAGHDGWTVQTPAADRTADQTGWVISQWTDAQGHVVDMTVSQTPSRVFQHAVAAGGAESVVAVRGTQAVLSPTGGNGGDVFGLTWQESKDVQIQLAIKGGTASEIQQVAESLVLADPSDPRISKS